MSPGVKLEKLIHSAMAPVHEHRRRARLPKTCSKIIGLGKACEIAVAELPSVMENLKNET